jgi:hypothetical protein
VQPPPGSKNIKKRSIVKKKTAPPSKTTAKKKAPVVKKSVAKIDVKAGPASAGGLDPAVNSLDRHLYEHGHELQSESLTCIDAERPRNGLARGRVSVTVNTLPA